MSEITTDLTRAACVVAQQLEKGLARGTLFENGYQ